VVEWEPKAGVQPGKSDSKYAPVALHSCGLPRRTTAIVDLALGLCSAGIERWSVQFLHLIGGRERLFMAKSDNDAFPTDAQDVTTRHRTVWDDRLFLVLSWLLVAGIRIWEARVAPARIWPDSRNYEAIGSKPFWSSGFWFGGRPPLTPLLWKLTGSPNEFVLGQALISVCSWGFLAWTVGNLSPGGWKRCVGVWLILGFAVTKPIALWDGSVLSESLALSGLAFLFAFLIRLAQKRNLPWAAGVVAAAFWCALARDTQIILPAILGLAVLIFAFARRRPRCIGLVLTGCALLLAAGFCVTTVVKSRRDAVNTEDNLYARVFPYPARVAWFASRGMPEAAAIDALVSAEPTPPSGTAKVVFPDLRAPVNAELKKWIDDHGASTYALWIATHPWLVVLEPLRQPPESFGNAAQGVNAYEAANTASFGLTPIFWASGSWMIAIAACSLVMAWRRGLRADRVMQAVGTLGLIGVPVMLVAWNGDGEETIRHTFEGLAEVHLGVFIVLLYVVLVPTTRRVGWKTSGRGSSEQVSPIGDTAIDLARV
jgi:hypothetical protein